VNTDGLPSAVSSPSRAIKNVLSAFGPCHQPLDTHLELNGRDVLLQ